MKITIAHRHYGVHADVAETEIPGTLADYATPDDPDPDRDCDDYSINEDKLLAALPDGFLPCPPDRVLLMVVDDIGGTGQIGLSRFRDWAKYFDAYCLNLHIDVRGGQHAVPYDPAWRVWDRDAEHSLRDGEQADR